MGLLLKIIIFAVAVYGAWSAARRWLGLFRGMAKPPEPPSRDANEQPRRVVVEDTRLCTVCGAYVSANAGKCGRADCPQG